MGLQRKKVTVRTKKGKTFQRSMMVKANGPAKAGSRKKLRSEGTDIERRAATKLYRTGLANAGLAAGANLGRHIGFKKDPHEHTLQPAGHMLGGAAAGWGAGHMLARGTERHLSAKNLRRLGVVGHVAGLAGATYNMHRTLQQTGDKHGLAIWRH